MKGYKVFNPNWTCRDFQYEVGKTYELDGELEMCKNGFHFCKELRKCFYYYNFYDDLKFAEVEAIGAIMRTNDDSKCCTNKIKIVREIDFGEMCQIIGVDEWNLKLLIKLGNRCVVRLGCLWIRGPYTGLFFWHVCNASGIVGARLNLNMIEISVHVLDKDREILRIQIQDKAIVLKEIEENEFAEKVLGIVEELLAE